MDWQFKVAIILILLIYLSQGMLKNVENLQIRFLRKLVGKIRQEETVETILILQHSAMDCKIQNWNYPEVPTLRFNELEIVEVRNSFNNVVLALVCICDDFGIILLESLAKDLNRLRQARIILWIGGKLTRKMVNVIATQVEKYQMYQMIILEAKEHSMSNRLTIRLLDPFPSVHFDKIDDILGLKGPIFYTPETNFKGKVINLLPDWDSALKINVTVSPGMSIPIVRNRDYGVIEFALKYNLSLRVLNASYKLTVGTSVVPDIQLKSQVHTNMDNLKNWNPHDISSLMVAVPCGKELRIEEVFKQLDVHSWLVYIFIVYGIFVVAEASIVTITHRMTGRAYRFTSLIPFLNLRAFRAILGMSFPISRRSSLSLRQLFLAINVFGLIFSSFFSCKLSALLMKYSDQPHVKNFEDLRDSGLPVIVGPTMDPFLKSEAGSDFVKNHLINLKYVSQWDRVQMLLKANTSNAYLLYSEDWNILDNFWKFYGHKMLCKSEHLTIIQALPITYILKNNSMLDRSLFRFMMRLQEYGFVGHWIKQSPYPLRKVINPTFQRNNIQRENPLSVRHFQWLWCVLGCGYGCATIVFIIELILGGKKKIPNGSICVV